MPGIHFTHVGFHYDEPYNEVFTDLSLTIDTGWRTGLTGRNGRGKSTLLKLITGELEPVTGQVQVPVPTLRYDPAGSYRGSCLDVARALIAPFDAWEQEMNALLAHADGQALERYAELQERFATAGGYEVNSLIEQELERMQLDARSLHAPFTELSLGQQTRVSIACLFIRRRLSAADAFALIDEPTNHLDLAGREQLASYLQAQPGFLLVSHDRTLLDACTDHTLALRKQDATVTLGNWSNWAAEEAKRTLHEQRRHDNLNQEIAHLENTARQRRSDAGKKEKEKYGGGVIDKGFVGHRAAKQMKRALVAERRIRQQVEEKSGLLGHVEKSRSLVIGTHSRSSRDPLVINNLNVSFGDQAIIREFSLNIATGERIAVTGPNGCGKSTLLKAILGSLDHTGIIQRNEAISAAAQTPAWHTGFLSDLVRENGFDETRFRQFLGILDVRGEIFEAPLETFSAGQLKKVELVRSILTDAGLLLWDEPMNYLDVDSRSLIETAILEGQPTMLVIEHDRRFIDTIATRVVTLEELL